MWNDEHMNDGWGVAMALGMVGITVALIAGAAVAVALVIRSTSSTAGGVTTTSPAYQPYVPTQTQPPDRRDPAQQILAERLARGEIDIDEFRARLDALNSATGRGAPSAP